jgi:hypothetical protein
MAACGGVVRSHSIDDREIFQYAMRGGRKPFGRPPPNGRHHPPIFTIKAAVRAEVTIGAFRKLAVLAVVSSVVTVFGFAAPAQAITHPLDGKDPVSAGCAGDARTAKIAEIDNEAVDVVIGVIELRYSPSCRTTWARAVLDVAPADGYAQVVRNQDLKNYYCAAGELRWKYIPEYYAYFWSCYSRMVYDGGYTSYAYSRWRFEGRIYEGLTGSY